jgi:hypothetical protein
MNTNTAFMMLAVLAAFGLIIATAVPIVQQAHAAVKRVHVCHNNPEQSPPCRPLRAR